MKNRSGLAWSEGLIVLAIFVILGLLFWPLCKEAIRRENAARIAAPAAIAPAVPVNP